MKKYKDTELDPNNQALQQSIMSEVGRVLGPAIAKVKAKEMGLEIAEDDMSRFGSESDMMKFGHMEPVRTIDDMPVTTRNLYSNLVSEITRTILDRLAETREQRRVERRTMKMKREHEKVLEELDVGDKKRVFPERTDNIEHKSKPKLFDASDTGTVYKKKTEYDASPIYVSGKIKIQNRENESWVSALNRSHNYDRPTKENIIRTENRIVDDFNNIEKTISDRLDSYTGRIENIDYQSLVHAVMDELSESIEKNLVRSFPQMYSFGDDVATDHLSSVHDFDKRTVNVQTLSKKAASAADKYKLDRENTESEIGSKIKLLTDDLKKEILDGIRKKIENRYIIRQVIKKQRNLKDRALEQATNREIRNLIKKEIRDLYSRQKYMIERVVRTESINTAARAQLIKYRDAGVKEVGLRTSHDPRVCPKCRNLEKSGRTWDIDKLMALGAYPLSTLTHPQCRCVFRPFLPDIEADNNIGKVRDVPKNETDNVRRLVKTIDFQIPVRFTKNIVDHPRFIPIRTEYYIRKGFPESRARLYAENDREKLRGKISNMTVGKGKDQEVVLDVNADRKERYVYVIAKIQAKKLWEKSRRLQKDIHTLFQEQKFRRDREKDRKLFFTRNARRDPKSYFAEGYAHYLVHPEILRELDFKLFDFLKTNLFRGREFVNFAL
jgi:SPP1 gp7 family putative phage head morphogenesis protein